MITANALSGAVGDLLVVGSTAPTAEVCKAPELSQRLARFMDRVGGDRVAVDAETVRGFSRSTIGVSRQIAGVFQPSSQEDVVQAVKAANEFGIPLYPVSKGNNWGYGSANPPVDGCVIVDLSRINRIIEVDRVFGTVTLEPGVTQQDLADYLSERDMDLMVPTHGGGPDCSILGNLLERGYGITPHTDHFGALLSLEAVLPTGELYRSPLSEIAGGKLNGLLKWGIGPYIDGLFAQSNLGIVTRATVALARRPECVEAFAFSVECDDELPAVVEKLRPLITNLGSSIGAINLMNSLRVLAMSVPYPHDRLSGASTIPPELLCKMERSERIKAWTVVGTLYGPRRLMPAIRREVSRALGYRVFKPRFITRRRTAVLAYLGRKLPGKLGHRLQRQANALQGLLDIASGIPRRTALPLAYWLMQEPADTQKSLNPAADGCGLLWYSPLVRMCGEDVLEYVRSASDTCRRHGVEPLITLTSLSNRAFDSTLPILFRCKSEQDVERANRCYKDLLEQGRERGWLPYRYSSNHMPLAIDPQQSYWKAVRRIKEALDPKEVLAPGRYCPVEA